MKDIYVILSILAIVIVIFIILFIPSPFYKKPIHVKQSEKIQRITHPPVVIPKKTVIKSEPIKQQQVCFDPRLQSLNSRKKGPIGSPQDEETLSSFYIPAKDAVPEDFPVKQIGECPYSKAQPNDVPLGNVPMCMADNPKYNMRVFHEPL